MEGTCINDGQSLPELKHHCMLDMIRSLVWLAFNDWALGLARTRNYYSIPVISASYRALDGL
jgi:hypothetical protein